MEIANQCDYMAEGRLTTNGGNNYYYEGPVRYGCWYPWEGLPERHWHSILYRTGEYKAYERRSNLSNFCSGWVENVNHPVGYHFHGYACFNP